MIEEFRMFSLFCGIQTAMLTPAVQTALSKTTTNTPSNVWQFLQQRSHIHSKYKAPAHSLLHCQVFQAMLAILCTIILLIGDTFLLAHEK